MSLRDRLFGSPRDRFARRMLGRIRATAGVAQAWYDKESFAVMVRRRGEESAPAGVAYLENMFRECQAAADSAWCDEQIDRFIRAVVLRPELPKNWEEVCGLLRPALRICGYGTRPGERADEVVARPVLPYIDEFVVVDQPDSMAYVSRAQLAEWGIEAATAFETARENQRQAAVVFDDVPAGMPVLRLVDTDGAYWASCLLVEGWLAALGQALGARPVAFFPDPENMYVAADRPDELGELFELVERERSQAPRGLFPTAYTVDDTGIVVPYKAPRGHALEIAVHRSECILAAEAYGSQAARLEAAYAAEDVFAAGVLVGGRPDGSLFTVATWAEGVDTLLPRADYVAFGSPSERFMTPWSVVATEAAPLLPVEGIRPERYRVRGWPPPSTMDRIRAAATEP